jgi:simple sugar transport system permease protein
VLIVTPCVGLCFGAINGILIVAGRMQPFIVTLAMMVTALGIARLTAGQNNAVLPVYTGSNAVAEFDALRSLVFGIVLDAGSLFYRRKSRSIRPCSASRHLAGMFMRLAAMRRPHASRE